MAGRISENDIAAVKTRANIVDVISDHVTLKRAGVGSFKGLCPFHDERTPSFTVSESMERYHCFGCQASGDVIAFLMNYQHLSFIEAVESLAARVGYQITYVAGSENSQGPSKTRLYAAHKAASEFYQEQLFSPAGTVAREFLYSRGFDDAALRLFELGYAPDTWDSLTRHLGSLGYKPDELVQGGLVSQGSRGIYDRFRGRPMWPIKDSTGQVVGFGARKILESDQGPKYLNSPETPIYHKSKVLYGIDLAKKAIAKDKRAIVVEGYTDVMACHLAGVPHAVATSGTAFGSEHIAVLRRVLGDDNTAEVIFTFDPDSAGQAAALKAYGEERRFNAQTYVATNSEGLDPSDLRQQRGDAAVVAMFQAKTPLFEFALQHAISGFDLHSVAGRHHAIASALPIIERIRDRSLQPAYVRELARMIGVDISVVKEQMRQMVRRPRTQTQSAYDKRSNSAASLSVPSAAQVPTFRQQPQGVAGVESYGSTQLHGGVQPQGIEPQPQHLQPQAGQPGNAYASQNSGQGYGDISGAHRNPAQNDVSDKQHGALPLLNSMPSYTLLGLPRDPQTRMERDALMAILQRPLDVGESLLSQAVYVWIEHPGLRLVLNAIAAALPELNPEQHVWVEQVVLCAETTVQNLVREMALHPLPELQQDKLGHYAKNIVIALIIRDLDRARAELLLQIQRLGGVASAESRETQKNLVDIEAAKRELMSQAEEQYD